MAGNGSGEAARGFLFPLAGVANGLKDAVSLSRMVCFCFPFFSGEKGLKLVRGAAVCTTRGLVSSNVCAFVNRGGVDGR
jgi:hypothetical protein